MGLFPIALEVARQAEARSSRSADRPRIETVPWKNQFYSRIFGLILREATWLHDRTLPVLVSAASTCCVSRTAPKGAWMVLSSHQVSIGKMYDVHGVELLNAIRRQGRRRNASSSFWFQHKLPNLEYQTDPDKLFAGQIPSSWFKK